MIRLSLEQLAALRREGRAHGITSVCAAHPLVLRAALRHGRETGATVLIEATCNQVNHLGGYTGMQPSDFVHLVMGIAREERYPESQIILGGDHLGPNPWRNRPAGEAMLEAEKMIAAYVAAGFRKIHLDASMGCAGEPVALDDETTAGRAVRLAAVAEEAARASGGQMPLYIIGTEVPPPGGAHHVLESIEPTAPEAVEKTFSIHRDVFAAAGLSDAFERVIGVVVQPGVEFGNRNIITYDRAKAKNLLRFLDKAPGLVFEAHSTDYQGEAFLSELVADGFAILKVGPELTFVLREALYGLDAIASDLLPNYGERPLKAALERVMLTNPESWQRHYKGSDAAWLRHYSLSDRIRYYWAMPETQGDVDRLTAALEDQRVPLPLFWQHLPAAAHFADTPLDPTEVVLWRIGQTLSHYHRACRA